MDFNDSSPDGRRLAVAKAAILENPSMVFVVREVARTYRDETSKDRYTSIAKWWRTCDEKALRFVDQNEGVLFKEYELE